MDDFETYTDDSDADEAIWQTWIDGLDDTSLGGSMVGNDPSPFAEMEIVYGGRQSMPLFYDNTSSPYFSETERTWTTPQNWSKGGATTLVVYFHGGFDNDADPIYAKINGTRIPFNGGAEVISRPLWRQWNIDLTTLNVQSVRTLTIGIGDGSPGGDGVLYVDAIRLYRVAPESATPADPGTDALGAYYAFDGNVSDGSGNGYTATVMGNEIYEDSPYDTGRAISFDGINDYLELPIGPLVASSDSMTVATRFNMLPNTNSWQRIFDFGNSSTEGYMLVTPQTGTNGAMRFTISKTGNEAGAESFVTTPSPLPRAGITWRP